MNLSSFYIFLPKSIGDFLRNLAFLLRLKPGNIKVGELPYLDEEALPYFLNALNGSRFFLEFGCGGSTITAAKMGKKIITVESDKKFLEAVKKIVGSVGNGATFLYANIGRTESWGIPIFKRKTPGRLKRWRTYFEMPWAIINSDTGFPDLVLVDGRFRVACALTTFKYLQGHPNSIVLVDDYIGRPQYSILEQYGHLEKVVGRMAVFRPKMMGEEALDAAINQSAGEWL